jgi:hypothetical protein
MEKGQQRVPAPEKGAGWRFTTADDPMGSSFTVRDQRSPGIVASAPGLCDLPGIGHLAWKAALSRDLPLLVNLTMLVALVTLLANTGSDLVSQTLRGRQA